MNIDKLTVKLKELLSSREGKDKLIYLVYKTAEATVDVYRKDKILRRLAEYVSNIEETVGLKNFTLKSKTNSMLIVFDFNHAKLPQSCSRRQYIEKEIKNIIRELIVINRCMSINETILTDCVGKIALCYRIIAPLNAETIATFNQGLFDLADSLITC